MLTFYFSGADGRMTEPEVLTTGMVGKQVRMEFSDEWAGLSKTAVFSNGLTVLDSVCVDGIAVIPAEVLAKPLMPLTVGVYGVSPAGDVVIPTIRAVGPRILPGVDPSGDSGTDPTLPIWAQIRALVGETDDLNTRSKETLVAAINEIWTLHINDDPVSAYDYAVKGGYTGSEAEFTAKLAAEYVRSVNGVAPDTGGNILLPIPEGVVLYTVQSITESEQSRARSNIGAASTEAVEAAQSTADEALSAANSADSKATATSSTASRAYTYALSAQSAASNAQTSAREASELAKTKLDAEGISTQTIVAATEDGNSVTLNVLVKN